MVLRRTGAERLSVCAHEGVDTAARHVNAVGECPRPGRQIGRVHVQTRVSIVARPASRTAVLRDLGGVAHARQFAAAGACPACQTRYLGACVVHGVVDAGAQAARQHTPARTRITFF